MKIVHIVGNRPQFIKLWALYEALSLQPNIQQTIIHTGQHSSKEMSDVFFEELNIPTPEYFLNIDNSNGPDIFIGNCSRQLQALFSELNADIIFTYGDTNTTLGAAIAAKRTNTQLHHFEAGVRTNEVSMPEEINRIVTDRLANVNYCCTQSNYQTLIAEGYSTAINSKAFLTGDLMFDAYKKAENLITIPNSDLNYDYIVASIHRADNIQNPIHLDEIIQALNIINKQVPVKMSLHPHTRKKLLESGIVADFQLLEPLSYLKMHSLIKNAQSVITDSGGVSREAFFAKKKSLIIMSNPFWQEIIHANCSINTSADTESILSNFENVKKLQPDFSPTIFGDGHAATNILKVICDN